MTRSEKPHIPKVMERSPYEWFEDWFKLARDARLPQYDAMALVTASLEGRPSARMVLLRGLENGLFHFFTNYESRKSRELSENPHSQLLFYWPQLGHQIRIEGEVRRLPAEVSDAYWSTRPRESRIGAIASRQSRPLVSMQELSERVKEVERDFEGKEVPRPENWGGWGLLPARFEFWKEGDFRLHERVIFEKGSAGSWTSFRLFP